VNDHTKLTGSAVRVQRGLIPLAKHIPTSLLIQLYQTIQQNRMFGNRKGLLLLDIEFDDRRDYGTPTHGVPPWSYLKSRCLSIQDFRN
jgi:hypothetical protein